MKRVFWSALLIIGIFLVVGAPSAQAKVGGKFAVALVLPGSLNDGSWNATAYRAAKQLESTLGVKLTVQEHIKPTEVERVFRTFAAKGYDVIIGHTFLYLDAILKVAKSFPKTAFLHVPGLKTRKNVSVGHNPLYEGYYLCGMIAGRITKTNVIGAVAGFEIPDTTSLVEAFREGAQAVNPKVKFLVTYAGTWHDSQKGKEAAIALIEAGADIVSGFGNGLTLGVVRGASEKGAYTFGYVGNMNSVAPKSVVTSVIWDLFPLYKEAVLQKMNGNFVGRKYRLGMSQGGVILAPYNIKLSAAIRKEVDQARQKIMRGEFKVPLIFKATVGGRKNK